MLVCSRLAARCVCLHNCQGLMQRGVQATCASLNGNQLHFLESRQANRPGQSSLSFSTGVIQSDDIGIFKKALKRFGFAGSEKARLKMVSFLLYEDVADKIVYPEFFDEFSLPNTFNSWFLVTELHVWMLLLRAMAEGSESGEDGRFIRNSIVEAMWADVNTRAKKLGANNPSGTRAQIEILSEQFQAALIAYDEGIMSDDKVLAGALWRRFFEKNCENYVLLERLVSYVRQQVKMLDSLNREDFIGKPKIRWIPLKDVKC